MPTVVQISAQINSLSLGLLKKFYISLAPLEERKRIVAKVDELMKLCDQLETHLANQQELGDRAAEAVAATA